MDIAFDGSAYAGWQRQPNALAVQEVIEKALSTLLREELAVSGAGRTDAGVHALKLPAHFDWDEELGKVFFEKINGILPDDISITHLARARDEQFHSRFSAMERAYIYQIVRGKNPFLQNYSLWVKGNPDKELLVKGAEILKEFSDFASFCKAHGNNATTICDLMEAKWTFREDRWVFYIKANRFLRGMVRGIVGTLLKVGEGRINLNELRQILEAKDRKLAGPNAAAQGLFLTEVHYPPDSLISIYPEELKNPWTFIPAKM